jgi:hypothetical protein
MGGFGTDSLEHCTSCSSKKRVPVWLIFKRLNDRQIDHASRELLCHPCFEKWVDYHYTDEYRIERLSNDNANFEVNDNGRRAANSTPTYAAHEG